MPVVFVTYFWFRLKKTLSEKKTIISFLFFFIQNVNTHGITGLLTGTLCPNRVLEQSGHLAKHLHRLVLCIGRVSVR